MPKLKTETDIAASRIADELSIRKIYDGDKDGRAELYKKYRPLLTWYLPGFMEANELYITEEDAKDRASEALAKLFDAIKSGQYDPDSAPLWPYLKTIAENGALNFWHKHYKRTVHFPTAGALARTPKFKAAGVREDDPIPLDMLPEGLYEKYFGEAARKQQDFDDRSMELILDGNHVGDFLAQLSPRDYDLFTLAYFKYKTKAAIAKLRNVAEGTVRSRMSRALAKYRKKYL